MPQVTDVQEALEILTVLERVGAELGGVGLNVVMQVTVNIDVRIVPRPDVG